MRIESVERGEQVANVVAVISQRNLLTLLQKSYTDGKGRTISATTTARDSRVPTFFVLGVERDDVHYAERAPGPLVVHAEVALQIACDLLNQVSDDLDADDAFVGHALDRLANQVAYIATQIAGRKIGVRS